MGTEVHFVAYTTPALDEAAIPERDDSRPRRDRPRRDGDDLVAQTRARSAESTSGAGSPVGVSERDDHRPRRRPLGGELSGRGIRHHLPRAGDLWKFGDAAEANPKLPDPKAVRAKKKLVDYRKVEIDESRAHGDARRRACASASAASPRATPSIARRAVLQGGRLPDAIVQAGGDLYVRGQQADGAPWVTGIRDPRGGRGDVFAMIELDGSRLLDGGRLRALLHARRQALPPHHRSAHRLSGDGVALGHHLRADAFLADAVDDAVFILEQTRN